MAERQVTILCDDSPGVLTRLILAAKRLGLAYTGHQVDSGEDGQRITLTIDGVFSDTEFEAKVREINGVREVVFGGGGGGGAAAPVPGAEGSNDLPRRIAAAWPKIMPLVQELEDEIGEKDAEARLHAAGVVSGGHLAANDTKLQQAGTIHEAMAACQEFIKPIANSSVEGSDLRVDLSLFTRRFLNTMDLIYGKELPHCDFLAGMIEGYVNCNGQLPTVRIKESKCRSTGDSFCMFHAEA